MKEEKAIDCRKALLEVILGSPAENESSKRSPDKLIEINRKLI